MIIQCAHVIGQVSIYEWLLGRLRENGKPSMTIQRNTKIQYDPHRGVIDVFLHRTRIVRVYRDGLYKIWTGGYNTDVTVRRINEYSPANARIKNKQIVLPDGTPVFEGMVLDKHGNILNMDYAPCINE